MLVKCIFYALIKCVFIINSIIYITLFVRLSYLPYCNNVGGNFVIGNEIAEKKIFVYYNTAIYIVAHAQKNVCPLR